MIKIENVEIGGWEAAIRGMRNPMNSWDKSDSGYEVLNQLDVELGYTPDIEFVIGKNDLKLMRNLVKAGNDHSKFARMINVTMDVTAPRMWFFEFDTYKVGTVSNSCSTMYTIHKKPFERSDFSAGYIGKVIQKFDNETVFQMKNLQEKGFTIEQIASNFGCSNSTVSRILNGKTYVPVKDTLDCIIDDLNTLREFYLETGDKTYWRQIIELLPQSYNQTRTIQLNYQVAKSMYHARKNHKLDE